jgi:hypothetical protein
MGRTMIRAIRSRITYANVTATLALVLAMSGGALAAKHYLINSTRQINPKVLKKLHGAKGSRGAPGLAAVGPQGVAGPEGKRGPRGETGAAGFSALSEMPRGGTESGGFSVSAPGKVPEFSVPAPGKEPVRETVEGAVTFPVPLSAPIENQVEVTQVAKPATNCLGPGKAARGWLCIYTRSVTNLEFERAYDPESFEEIPAPGRTGRFGFGTRWKVKDRAPAEEGENVEGPVEAAGTWSVTTP